MDHYIAETTRLLRACSAGKPEAAEELLPHVYDQLRGIARRLLQSAHGGHTLQPTELIHEAYVRLIDPVEDEEEDRRFTDRLHFTRVAARAMRFVLVDHARARLSQKRGGDRHRVTLDTRLADVAHQADGVVFVHEGLESMAAFDPQLAQIVELRFFGGMTMEEIAQVVDASLSTVNRGWRLARAWWIREFGDDDGEGADA